MLYDLTNILDKERFKRRSNELYKKGAIVELAEKKDKRTLPQNAYLHLIIGWYAIETGDTIEFVKQHYFKKLCNPSIFCRIVTDKHLGEIEVLRSSKDCDTRELTTAIEVFRNWSSAECGIYLPSSEEQHFLSSIQVEISKNQKYL